LSEANNQKCCSSVPPASLGYIMCSVALKQVAARDRAPLFFVLQALRDQVHSRTTSLEKYWHYSLCRWHHVEPSHLQRQRQHRQTYNSAVL